jgi:hypothetical protein
MKMIFNKKIFVFVVISLICSTNLFAYGNGPGSLWEKTYGGSDFDVGRSVQETYDSGYIVTGHTYSYGAGHDDVYLIKTDSFGDTLWTKTYGGSNRDEGNSIQETYDSGYIVTGFTSSYGAGSRDAYLIKTDSLGDTLWTKTYGGTYNEQGRSVQQTLDGGYIIAGWTESFGHGGKDIYLIRTNSLGDTLWTKTYGGIDDDQGYSVQQTSDGSYIIAGLTKSFGRGVQDVYLIKTDSLGDTLWTKTYGGTSSDAGFSVQQTSDGCYIITGGTYSYGAGSCDVYLIKTDSLGDTLWTKTYGGSECDCGRSVQETYDKGYIVIGYIDWYGISDVYLVKTDLSGDTLWTKTFGGLKEEQGFSVLQTSDSAYIIAGWTESFGAGWTDVYLIKTSRFMLNYPNGKEELVWYKNYNIVWFCDKFHSIEHHFQLLFSSDGGISYSDTIAKNISQDSTTWKWSVPCIQCTTCRVKIQALDSLNNLLEEDESDSNFTIQPIRVISPNGGEMLWWYSIHNIVWECEYASITPTSSYFQLLFSQDGGVTYPDTIAKNISVDHSSWEWQIPSIQSNECRVKIQFYNAGTLFAEDESDSNFTISALSVEEKKDKQLPKWPKNLFIYPNPFTRMLNIKFSGTTENQKINLKIYDLSGRLVNGFSISTTKSSHTQTIIWDGKNKHSKDLSSGIYFLRFEAGTHKVTKQILLLR